MKRAGDVYGAGATLLGLVGLAFGDFALQWQPVAATLAGRTALAYLSAAILLAAGAATLLPRTRRLGAAALAAIYAAWTLSLHLPRVIGDPADLTAWLGLCEFTALAAGGLMLFLGTSLTRADRPRLRGLARLLFGACLPLFGLTHVVYAEFTAAMVPSWIPAPLFWAYATGAAHAAAGVAILTGVLARAASALLALMFAIFVTVLHVPRVLAAPAAHAEWVMLGVALSLTGAALVVFSSLPPRNGLPRQA